MKVHLPDYGSFDNRTDLAKMLRDEAEGRLVFGNPRSGADGPGEFLVQLVRAEPAFLPKVLAVLRRLIRDPSPRVRSHVLEVMRPINNAENVTSLREAMAADPRQYVGIRVGSDPLHTLFTLWLYALGANYPYAWKEAQKAIDLAEPYLELPEAHDYGFKMKATLRQDAMIGQLPGWAERASDERLEKFLDHLEPANFEKTGLAMRKASAKTLQRFARAAHRMLAERFQDSVDRDWAEFAAALGVNPDQY